MNEAKQIFELLPKVAADVGVVGKNQKNSQQNYQFRAVDDVIDTTHPAFVKHGVSIVPEVLNIQREKYETKSGSVMFNTLLTVRFSFYAPDGSSVAATVVGEGSDVGDKSANKAMSGALKYALGQCLLIPFDLIDSEAQDPPEAKASPSPAAPAKPAAKPGVTQGGDSVSPKALEAIGKIKDIFGRAGFVTPEAQASALAEFAYSKETEDKDKPKLADGTYPKSLKKFTPTFDKLLKNERWALAAYGKVKDKYEPEDSDAG